LWGVREVGSWLPAIDLTSVGDPGHHDLPIPIIDGIDDAMVADADPKVVTSRQPDRPWRSWLRPQPVDGRPDPISQTAMQPAVGADGLGVQADFVTERAFRQLAANLRPRNAAGGILSRLKCGQAVLQEVQSLDQFGVPIDVDEDARQSASLGHVEHVVLQRVEFPSQPGAEILGRHHTRHVTNHTLNRTV
jgi:hypothetical protein